MLCYDPQRERFISIGQIFPICRGLKAVPTPFEQQIYKIHGGALVAVGEGVAAGYRFEKGRSLPVDCPVIAGVVPSDGSTYAGLVSYPRKPSERDREIMCLQRIDKRYAIMPFTAWQGVSSDRRSVL